jgi:hypothetical protein
MTLLQLALHHSWWVLHKEQCLHAPIAMCNSFTSPWLVGGGTSFLQVINWLTD